MEVDQIVAALGGRYDRDESAIIERMLRDCAGTVPDAQLIEEIGLALAVRRQETQNR